MRIFLLPVSTRRSLLYCQRLPREAPSERQYVDKITDKANAMWISWEAAEKGWKKKVTEYGNQAFKRIPYEEWGLKTIPPLSAKRKAEVIEGKEEKEEVMFPGRFVKEGRVLEILQTLATERQALHRKRLIWSIVGMPISAPFALVPVVPNLPFFYLCFRAWSHWRALRGSQHLEFLLQNKYITPSPSSTLDEMYAAGLIHPTRQHSREAPLPTQEQINEVSKSIREMKHGSGEEVMQLQRWNGKLLAERFELPQMEVEIERAVEQVEKSISAQKELKEEKKDIERASDARPQDDVKS